MQFVKNWLINTHIYKFCEEKIKNLLTKIEKRNVKKNSYENINTELSETEYIYTFTEVYNNIKSIEEFDANTQEKLKNCLKMLYNLKIKFCKFTEI